MPDDRPAIENDSIGDGGGGFARVLFETIDRWDPGNEPDCWEDLTHAQRGFYRAAAEEIIRRKREWSSCLV
jgi:hypothetical protein